jgi:hypothetical protein
MFCPNETVERYNTDVAMDIVKVKVKLSRYRSGVAQRVPGS